MQVNRIDHLVLTVADIERTVAFYQQALGFKRIEFGGGRVALTCGRQQKINLHEAGREFDPKSARPTPGSGDFCLILDGALEDFVAHLAAEGIPIEDGPVARTGATGPILSVYIRDPDENLVEISVPEGRRDG